MSPGEIFVELKAGFKPEQIFYISNNVTAEEMKFAIDHDVLISVDSVSQLETYGKLNPGGKIAARFNGGIGAGHSEKVVTAGKKTKFAVNPEFIPQFKEVLAKYDLKLVGINQHIGSLFMDGKPYVEGVKAILNIAKQFDAVVTAQCIGARHYEEARKSAKQLIIVAITLSIVIMVGCLIFNRHILRVLFGSIDNDVMHNAMLYFLISSASYPFLALYNSCAALFRSMGNSAISMKVSILMNVINICGNAILIFVFKMGVEGVAIPSLVSRFVAAIIMLVLIRNKNNVVYVDHHNFKPEFCMIRRILYIAIPSGMENGIFQFGRIIVVSIISTFGTVQIAANAVANSIDGMGTLCGQAISLAMITVVGQCVGAGDLIAY